MKKLLATALGGVAIFAVYASQKPTYTPFGFGGFGTDFGHVGNMGVTGSGQGGNAVAPGCTQTGIFDLTTQCNMIYLVGRRI